MQPGILKDIDGFIREGEAERARRELGKLRKAKLPREYALAVAALARRAGLPGLSLRVLNPIVRPSPKSPLRATASEKAEYAASLIRVGAGNEALTILKSLDKGKNPESLLFEAMALFTQWEYSAAIPILERYSEGSGLDPYQRLVGKVNLAAAYLFDRDYHAASAALAELREETKTRNHALLVGNSLELSAQLAIFQKKWAQAEGFLNEAKAALKHSGGLDELFVKKWTAIATLLKGRNKKGKKGLDEVRLEARGRKHWETLRECDLFEAIANVDSKLLTHLYFGTPFRSYRRRIFLEYGHPVVFPETYVWRVPDRKPSSRKPKLLSFTADQVHSDDGLKKGQLLHRLTLALASDFYRPQRVAVLHSVIYPDHFFNPISSPMRIHQAIRRLKHWLGENRIPLTVREAEGSYSLEATAPCALLILREPNLAESRDYRLRRLKQEFTTREFSAREAANVLSISDRTTLRLLKDAVERRELYRSGSSASTRYAFGTR